MQVTKVVTGTDSQAYAVVKVVYGDVEFIAEVMESHRAKDVVAQDWVNLREKLLEANREYLRRRID